MFFFKLVWTNLGNPIPIINLLKGMCPSLSQRDLRRHFARRTRKKTWREEPTLVWALLCLHVISGAAMAMPQKGAEPSGARNATECAWNLPSAHLIIGLIYLLRRDIAVYGKSRQMFLEKAYVFCYCWGLPLFLNLSPYLLWFCLSPLFRLWHHLLQWDSLLSTPPSSTPTPLNISVPTCRWDA